MDWVDGGGVAPERKTTSGSAWRESRGDLRAHRRGFDERLEGWVSRGREVVEGVSGARPGSRLSGRGAERSGAGGRGALEGMGRWVEGKLDWLLDDRDDWQEPWQDAERPSSWRGGSVERTDRGERWQPAVGVAGAAEERGPSPRRSRAPLEAVSRRNVPSAERPRQPASAREAIPPPREASPSRDVLPPRDPAIPPGAKISRDPAIPGDWITTPRQPSTVEEPLPRPEATTGSDWPEEDSFTVSRWRRQDSPAPKPVDPLAPAAAPAPPAGRPLPRSTRRR